MLATLTNTLVFATQGDSAAEQAERFFNSGIGSVIQSVLVVAAFAVIIFSLFKVVMKALQGNTTGALKSLGIGIFIAVIFFSPRFIGSFIDILVNVWNSVVTTTESVVSNEGGAQR